MTDPNERERLIEELRKFAEISGDHLYCHDPWNSSNTIRIAVQAALAEIDELRYRLEVREVSKQCAAIREQAIDEQAATLAEQAAEIEILKGEVARLRERLLAELRRRV